MSMQPRRCDFTKLGEAITTQFQGGLYTIRGHGRRGALLAESLRGSLFDLEDSAFELLHYACEWHTDRDHSEDPTIGTCWDSDRLDLGRVNIIPSEEFMSTDFGKEVAKAGSFLPFLSDEEKADPAVVRGAQI